MTTSRQDPRAVARAVASQFAQIPEVEAVALGGSQATGKASPHSDVDLYVFSRGGVPLEARAAIIHPRASRVQLDNDDWETEDWWIEQESGVKIEVIYRNPDWISERVQDALEGKGAQMGYSTSLWHSVKTSEALFDRHGWFASLQARAETPYPDVLARAIIDKNFALLRGSLAAHPKQLPSAVERDDLVFVQNLVYMILASYFDVLFALNRAPHPGAKRQLAYAEGLELKPEGMAEDVRDVLTSPNTGEIIAKVDRLVRRLEALLAEHDSVRAAYA